MSPHQIPQSEAADHPCVQLEMCVMSLLRSDAHHGEGRLSPWRGLSDTVLSDLVRACAACSRSISGNSHILAGLSFVREAFIAESSEKRCSVWERTHRGHTQTWKTFLCTPARRFEYLNASFSCVFLFSLSVSIEATSQPSALPFSGVLGPGPGTGGQSVCVCVDNDFTRQPPLSTSTHFKHN